MDTRTWAEVATEAMPIMMQAVIDDSAVDIERAYRAANVVLTMRANEVANDTDPNELLTQLRMIARCDDFPDCCCNPNRRD